MSIHKNMIAEALANSQKLGELKNDKEWARRLLREEPEALNELRSLYRPIAYLEEAMSCPESAAVYERYAKRRWPEIAA